MLQDVIARIQEERDRVLSNAQSARIFLELVDPKRLQRGGEILRGGMVSITKEEHEGVWGECLPSGGGEPYRVGFKVRALRVRGASCTCHEGMQGEICKHVIALCAKWMLEQKSSWQKLTSALKTLEA